MKTDSIKKKDISRDWHLIDASGKTLGRLSSKVASILRGKNKVNYSPNIDMSDFVVIINSDKIKVTGNKENAKDLIVNNLLVLIEKDGFNSAVNRGPAAFVDFLHQFEKGFGISVRQLMTQKTSSHPHRDDSQILEQE